MQIDLDGRTLRLHGDRTPLVDAGLTALIANGAIHHETGAAPDILLVSLPLLPCDDLDTRPLIAAARRDGEAMLTRGMGRILFIVSTAAGIPIRRHPEYSVEMAATVAAMRGLAMRFGPSVLVNALGVGPIGTPLLAGDTAMLEHASVKRAGTIQEVIAALLFLCDPLNSYTTGQLLSVDGGWSAGYARNF
jgi:NAD(P)-dependent dehydrogenase (short-subunit alcohol dehydrogenase family)